MDYTFAVCFAGCFGGKLPHLVRGTGKLQRIHEIIIEPIRVTNSPKFGNMHVVEQVLLHKELLQHV